MSQIDKNYPSVGYGSGSGYSSGYSPGYSSGCSPAFARMRAEHQESLKEADKKYKDYRELFKDRLPRASSLDELYKQSKETFNVQGDNVSQGLVPAPRRVVLSSPKASKVARLRGAIALERPQTVKGGKVVLSSPKSSKVDRLRGAIALGGMYAESPLEVSSRTESEQSFEKDDLSSPFSETPKGGRQGESTKNQAWSLFSDSSSEELSLAIPDASALFSEDFSTTTSSRPSLLPFSVRKDLIGWFKGVKRFPDTFTKKYKIGEGSYGEVFSIEEEPNMVVKYIRKKCCERKETWSKRCNDLSEEAYIMDQLRLFGVPNITQFCGFFSEGSKGFGILLEKLEVCFPPKASSFQGGKHCFSEYKRKRYKQDHDLYKQNLDSQKTINARQEIEKNLEQLFLHMTEPEEDDRPELAETSNVLQSIIEKASSELSAIIEDLKPLQALIKTVEDDCYKFAEISSVLQSFIEKASRESSAIIEDLTPLQLLVETSEKDLPERAEILSILQSFVEEASKESSAIIEELKSLQLLIETVEKMHKAGYFHRDIKPPNLLGINGPEGAVFKVADFGSAAGMTESTKLQQVTGSPMYRGPEFDKAHHPDKKPKFTNKSEIFSVGTTLFEIVFGEKLYDEVARGYTFIQNSKRSSRVNFCKDARRLSRMSFCAS